SPSSRARVSRSPASSRCVTTGTGAARRRRLRSHPRRKTNRSPSRRTSLRALACPASFKGVLSAAAAAEALAEGFRSGGAGAFELPIADGGEGTAEAFEAALGGVWREAEVADPLGRPHRARWLALDDGRAVVEAAAAVGLPLLSAHELDPLRATSRGF